MSNIFDYIQEPDDGARIVVEIRPGWAYVYQRDDTASEAARAGYRERWRSCDGRISRVQWFTFEEIAASGGTGEPADLTIWVLGAPVVGAEGTRHA